MTDPEPAGWQADLAPRLRPLTYPGAWPDQSILLTDDGHVPFDHETMDELLTGRTPVLAVGSNASPAQLRHKFGPTDVPLVVPLLQVDVKGLGVGVAADVAPYGSLPATALVDPSLSARLFALWLNPAQLELIDATERGYRRITLTGASGVQVIDASGAVVEDCRAYASRRGHLLDESGSPLRLVDQSSLIRGLLARSRPLRRLAGESPTSWIRHVRHEPKLIPQLRELFETEGWVAGSA